MSVSFNAIPIDIRTPGQYVEFDSSRAVQGTPAQPHRILVLGQRLAAGEVQAGVPVRVLTAAAAEKYFGPGSMLAAMFAALKRANAATEVWGVALDDDAAGVAAKAEPGIQVTGPATAAGTIALYIGGRRVAVAVAKDDAATAIAAALAEAINADPSLPVTAQVDGVVDTNVNLTCKWKGESGNALDLRVGHQGEALPAGVALVLAPLAGGATNPDVTAALAAIGDMQFHTVVMPYTDATNLGVLEAELEERWGPMVQKEGHAFAAAGGTHAELVTLGEARNSQFLTVLGLGKSPTPPWEGAALLGGVDAAETDPARPRQTLALPGLSAPAELDRFTRAERDLLLHAGVSTFTVDAGGVCRIERLITTYQTNAAGVADTAFLDLTTLRTLAYLRYAVRTRIALRYARHKLASDGTRVAPGQAVVTPATLRAELIGLFLAWEQAGLVEGFEQFKDDLVVERDAGDPNRVNAVLSPDLINQFRVFAGQIQFLI